MHCDLAELHAYLDGALQEERRRQLQAHLSDCARCQQRLQSAEEELLQVDDALGVLRSPPAASPPAQAQLQLFYQRLEQQSAPHALAYVPMPHKATKETNRPIHTGSPAAREPSSARAHDSRERASWFAGWWLPAAVGAFALVLFLQNSNRYTQNPAGGTSTPGHSLEAKGGLLSFHMLVAPRHLRPTTRPMATQAIQRSRVRGGDTLHAGDLVQFIIQQQKAGHLMVVSLNQKGEVFPFVPFQGKRSVWRAKGRHALPQGSALELDAYTGAERFFLVQRAQPFSLQALRQSLLRAWREADKDVRKMERLPAPWKFRSILIQKKTRKVPQ